MEAAEARLQAPLCVDTYCATIKWGDIMPTRRQWLELEVAEVANEDRTAPWSVYPCIRWPYAQKAKWWREGRAYGAVYSGGKLRSVHRVAWELAYGPIPNGLHVLHFCDERPCFRPVHLFLGTCTDNLRDCSRKGRMHPGELNGGAKLTAEAVDQIRTLLADGTKQRELARRFHVSNTAIWKIANGLKWKSMPPRNPESENGAPRRSDAFGRALGWQDALIEEALIAKEQR